MSLVSSNQIAKANFGAVNDAVILDVSTSDLARFEFSGTYAFTAVFETSVDGVNWFPTLATKTDAATTTASHAAANAIQAYTIDCRAVAKVRARLSAFTSAGAHKVLISSK